MKTVYVLNTETKVIKRIELPEQFYEEVRPDIIKRAFLAIQSHKRQPYGANPEAGKRASVRISKRRRDYRTSYGHGISRVPRKILLHRGAQMFWVGAFAPGTVGGRRAHPPKSIKRWYKKINDKERKKAIRSALAATIIKEYVEKRGHILPPQYPMIIETKIETISKTKDIKNLLENLGLKSELERATKKKVRAGKGKLRGRKYKKKVGPLIVVSQACELIKAARNIPGIDVIEVQKLNTAILAPGAIPGRLCIFTEAAINKLEKEGLFL